ncbi:hypothetical protein [Nocardia brasiliensis]|uniref:ATP synthase I chain n=1 Tax=Nocardia brasiliensis (strain ATCC 700358 / HUJEG-1) TaxID=1133849 RepID=K0FB30_NOCB7|nr:hypothetical protein [Nocardia brasiliensis]AFU04661.1 ATP synthase I chain [Nocardia brasiliensis ATCC 700358]
MMMPTAMYFCAGLALGWGNALWTRRAITRIVDDDVTSGRLILLSMTRLLVLTVVSIAIAFLAGAPGVGVFFGLAIFHAARLFRIRRPALQGQT